MTIKKQLWEEIESSSDELLLETLDFLQYLKTKNSNKSRVIASKNRIKIDLNEIRCEVEKNYLDLLDTVSFSNYL